MKKWKLDGRIKKMYIQDYRDERDYIVIQKKNMELENYKLPSYKDMRNYCPKVKDIRKIYENKINSCMTHTVLTCLEMMMNISIVENDIGIYFKKKNKKSYYYNNFIKYNHTNFFIEEYLYSSVVTKKKKLSYRSILKALNKNGCKFYSNNNFTTNYKINEYARIAGCKKKSEFLKTIKMVLASNVPIIGAIIIPDCTTKHEILGSGVVDFNFNGKKFFYGILIVGYDDNMEYCGNKGFLIFQNSLSNHWGDKGFGYIPYSQVNKIFHLDFWIISSFDFECIDTNGHKQLYYDTYNQNCLFEIFTNSKI